MSLLSDPREMVPDAAPLSELLGHAASELRTLCSAAYTIETAVGALLSQGPSPASAEMQGLQELDRLIQHIDGLAGYLAALAEAAEGMGTVDVTAARQLIKLAGLADSLAGRPARKLQSSCDDSVEFF